MKIVEFHINIIMEMKFAIKLFRLGHLQSRSDGKQTVSEMKINYTISKRFNLQIIFVQRNDELRQDPPIKCKITSNYYKPTSQVCNYSKTSFRISKALN